MEISETYQKLLNELQRIHSLESIQSLLGWDEQVNLPQAETSAVQRAAQMAALSDIVHREFTAPQIDEWLKILESDLDPVPADRECVVREARRDYDRAVKIPSEFVAKKAAHESKSFHAWAKARASNDFAYFAPYLETQIELAQEEAAFLNCSGELAYDYHIDKHDPGLTAASIEALFNELKEELVPLVRQVLNSPIKPDLSIFKNFPVAEQNEFLRDVTKTLGFDYERGRIDIALHPFCSGNAADTRMTTRYDVDNPLDSLFSSIHETGHGLYEQGLPVAYLGTGLGEAVGMGVHESQSRLWENQVARSRAFWQYFEPTFREKFHEQLKDISSDELYLAINAVSLNPIRVDSDEVTYNLHIILRFELEKKLFSGELAVKDLPEAWNLGAQEIIGLTPKDDAEGVLQDVHWSGGSFGYFPSYCLGNMLAAQLWYTANDSLPGLEEDFSKGDFSRLLTWLRENIHCHGKRYDTHELTKRVTGENLSPKSLIRYLKERYLPLY